MVSTVPERVTVWVGSVLVSCPSSAAKEPRPPTRTRSGLPLGVSCISPVVAELIYSALAKFPHQCHAKPSVFHRLCRNWKNLGGGDAHPRSPLQSGRWGLAKGGPISAGEAPQLRETETVGNFPDVYDVGIRVAQRAADCFQPTQEHVLVRAHAKKFGAARPKGPVAHDDQLAQFRHMQGPAQMFRQDLLEPDHDPGMMALGVSGGPGADVRQTGDQHLDQTLFNGPRDLAVRQNLGLCLGEATDATVQTS